MSSRLPTRALALGVLLAAVLLLPLAAPSPAATGGCPGAGAKPSQASLETLRDATHCLLNKRRASRGKGRLRANGKLTRAATRHSRAMARLDFFAHDSPKGDDLVRRVRRAGYLSRSSSWSVAENIGWGSGSRATPRAMVSAWMKSPGHRANILHRSFRHVGVGLARGGPVRGFADAATYTTDFGRR